MKHAKEKKDFIDPAITSAVGLFVFRSVAQAVIGWLGLEFLKKYFKKTKIGQNNENTYGTISREKPTEKT